VSAPDREEIEILMTMVALHAILSRPFSAGVMPSALVDDAVKIAREFMKKVNVP